MTGFAYESGLFEKAEGDHPIVANLFSALAVMGVVTILLAPIPLKRVLAQRKD